MKKIFLCLNLILFLYCNLAAFPWPYKNATTEQQKIRQTVGASRKLSTDKRFHIGIDIEPKDATDRKVYAINSGIVEKIYTIADNDVIGVRINGLRYFHVVLSTNIVKELDINIGDCIGELENINSDQTDHVHLQRGTPLNDNLLFELNNFVDNAKPIVTQTKFYRQETEIELTSPTIYGQVDIAVKGYDEIGAGLQGTDEKLMPYKLGYKIIDYMTNEVKYDRFTLNPTIILNRVASHNGYSDLIHKSGATVPEYWITNEMINENMPQNKAWNIKQKINGAWNENAIINSESQIPDGIYKVQALLADTKSNVNIINQNSEKIRSIDNFRPYLKKAEIIRNSDDETKYYKEWTLDGTILTYLEPEIEEALGNDNYTIKFEFSEPVVNPTLSIDTLDDLILSSDEPVGNQKNFKTTLIINDNSPIEDGEYIMTVKAADLAGNNLFALNQYQTTINPATQLTRNAEGTMQGTGGSDTSVVFKIDRTPPTITYLNLQETPHFTCKDNDNCGTPETPKHILWIPSKFNIVDVSSISKLNIYKDNFGELYYSETLEDIENINRTFTFIEGSTYTMVATDTLEQSTTMYFIADAFRPYLKKAEIIRDSDDETKYSKEWTLYEDNLRYGPRIDKALGNDNYTIKFEFSEPVVNPTLSIDTLDDLILSSDEPVGNQKNFTAELIVEDNPPIEDGEYIMTVEAKDLTGNSILALNQDQTTINPATQLTRNAEGTMQGIGGSDTQEITMKKIILSTAILLGVTNFAMAENNGIDRSTETQEMENYTSEVLIVGKWGRGDKEFGLTKREDGPDVGPNAIAVDKAENLYILDPANKRIVVYKKNGKYLNSISLESLKQYQLYSSLGNSFAVDSSGNIFIFTQNRDFYYGSVVVKIDRQGKILRQYASLAPLKENFDPSSSKFLERFNKIKKAPEMNIFPETVGKLMGPVVDNDGNVYAMAEQGILIPLSQEINMKITSYPGHPMENRKNYIVRDPKVPLTKYLPKKPALIKNLFVKTAKGKIIATINANDIQKYLPTAAKIDGIHYKRSDIFGNKFFLIWTEDIGNRCFVIRFDPNWRPTVLTAIQNVSYHPFVISHDGNILQLVWDSAKIDDGVKILKWMVKP